MSTATYAPANVVRDLKELNALTGGPDGARRLADGIARSLFLEDAAWHEAEIHAFAEQELTGDEFAGRLA